MAWRWRALATGGASPSPRSSFASTFYDGKLVVAGGLGELVVAGRQTHDDVLELDIELRRWRTLKITRLGNPAPTMAGRALFGSVGINEKIYIHGGTDRRTGHTTFEDVLELDVRRATMRTLPTVAASVGEDPGPLFGQAMAAFGDSLWVFGGARARGKPGLSADIYQLELPVGSGTFATWRKLDASGFMPYARQEACLLAAPASPELYLFGGADSVQDYDDAYSFHTDTHRWERLVNAVDSSAASRSRAACALLPLPATDNNAGEGPAATYALLVHGGFNDTGKHDLVQQMHLGPGPNAWRWSELRSTRSVGTLPPAARMGHTIHVVNASFAVGFGGEAERVKCTACAGDPLNDVFVGVPSWLVAKAMRVDEVNTEASDGKRSRSMDEGRTETLRAKAAERRRNQNHRGAKIEL